MRCTRRCTTGTPSLCPSLLPTLHTLCVFVIVMRRHKVCQNDVVWALSQNLDRVRNFSFLLALVINFLILVSQGVSKASVLVTTEVESYVGA